MNLSSSNKKLQRKKLKKKQKKLQQEAQEQVTRIQEESKEISELNRQKQMLDEVEEDPSLPKQHISAIKAKIKANQANRLLQKKLADERQAAEGAKSK